MFSITFKSSHVVYVECIEYGKTITGDYCLNHCLKPTVREINKQRPSSDTTNMKMLHDGARPHITKSVTKCLNQVGIIMIHHPQ